MMSNNSIVCIFKVDVGGGVKCVPVIVSHDTREEALWVPHKLSHHALRLPCIV